MYQTQPAKLLLEALKQRNKAEGIDNPVNSLNKELYLYRAGRRGIEESLDQFEMQLNVIRDCYYNEPEDVHGLCFSRTPSVLNILLHFTKDKLVVDDDKLYCRYRTVDEWHKATSRLGEDLFTTSYLAAYDLFNGLSTRSMFLWKPYLDVETNDVNKSFDKEIAEVHAHLKGSSLNFTLSWLSLMNYPCHREGDFLMLFNEKQFHEKDKKGRDLVELYKSVSLAVALRLYLFVHQMNVDASAIEETIDKMCKCDTVNELQSHMENLSAYTWAYRSEYGRVYKNLGSAGKCPDYAINDSSYNINSILSGERRIMYNAFRASYDGDDKTALFLYAYIIFKQQLREKIIQMNEVVGFANFDNYERQKSRFIPDGSVYERLLTPLAFLNFLQTGNPKRYMEGRVVPKNTVEKNSVTIRKMDKDVMAWIHPEEREENLQLSFSGEASFNGYYIMHFIKKSDDKPSPFAPRHSKLRNEVKKQAIAFCEYRRKGYKSAGRIVGLDAANSEIKCRPEVFAQAYRFLRRHTICEKAETHPAALGMTYHVGEDYFDIVDGLRAVDEVLTYMNFRSNDRLGHALVLGTDVGRYYEGRYRTIRARKQVLLDNFVWLYVRVVNMAGRIALCEYLEREACRLYKQIFDNTERDLGFDIYDYYDSWLLRGNAPESVLSDAKPEESVSEWGKFALNIGENDVNRAWQNEKARELYYEYHFNRKAKEEGEKSIIFPIAHNYYDEFVKMVDAIRERLLCKVERLHIAIECNPSSNLRIGEMRDYIEHPILKFNNYGLNTPYTPHEISVSINTDDSGVFSTSLEREYALMGIVLEKTDDERFSNSPRAVKEWLNRVRKMSVEQKFKKE